MINFRKAHQHLIFLLILNIASKVGGECSCGGENEDGDRNKSLALKYKMVAIASILLAGVIGVCFPLLGKSIKALRPEKEIFFLIKAFAAGVILSTGFIHVLPDATESLTPPSLDEKPWTKFPFAGLVAMTSAIATLMVDTLATSHFTKSQNQQRVGGGDEEKTGEHENNVHVHTHATHGHAHGSASFLENSQLTRHRVVSQVLELGIVVHSVIIGMSLGASESPKTIKPLVAALTFHQFFEGMGLGGCISQAKFKSATVAIMAMFFSLTTPVGIAIGIAISNIYDEDSPKALIVEGILNAASAGILIYMALVDLLATDFMNQKVQTNVKLQIGTCLSLILGAALMSLLAIWA